VSHRGPAARAGLGDERLIGPIHGRDGEGGGGPKQAASAGDGALVVAQLVQHH